MPMAAHARFRGRPCETLGCHPGAKVRLTRDTDVPWPASRKKGIMGTGIHRKRVSAHRRCYGCRRLHTWVRLPLASLAAIAVVGAFFLAAAPSAGAAIAFAPPAQLTADCNSAATLTPPYLQVVMDASGDEFAAWMCLDVAGDSYIVQAATLPAGGSWSSPVTLDTNGGSAPAIGIDGNGNGLVAWATFNGASIDGAVITPSGSVANQMTISSSGGSSPTVAVNPGGDAVVGFVGADGDTPYAALGSLNGGFQSPVALAGAAGRIEYNGVALAIDANGDAAGAWCTTTCSSAVSAAGGAFSSATAFPTDGGSVDGEPMIAIDPSGNVTIAWEKVGSSSGGWAMYAAQEPLTGGFGSAQQLSPASSQIVQPVMASDASGDTVVAWVDAGVSGLPVEAATLQAGTSSFQPWFQVGNDGNFGNFISATVDANGTATVSWTDQTESCGCPPYPPSYSASFSTATPTTAGRMVHGGTTLVPGSSSRPVVVTQLPAGATVPDSTGGLAGSIGVIWAGVKKSRKDVFASTGKQLRYQPDALIKQGSDKSYLGLGVFNTTGALQTSSTSEPPGHSATFDLKLVNAVLRSDTLALKGCASSSGFTVRYLRRSTDVTNAVTAGSYTTGTLAPAASQTLKLTIAVSSTATVGTTMTCLVTASSATQPKRKDVVEAKVKVTAG